MGRSHRAWLAAMGVESVGDLNELCVREGHPSFAVAYRLRQLIDPHVPICAGFVPRTSILREFVGGSGFDP